MKATMAVLAFFAAILVLVLCGCRAQRSVASDTRETTETVTSLVPRDTLLPVPKDSVHLRLPLPVPVPDVPAKSKRKGRATTTVSVSQGSVQADCVCDTASIKARLWDRFTRTNKNTVTTTKEVVVKTRTPAWAWWMVAAVAAYILLRLLLANIKPL